MNIISRFKENQDKRNETKEITVMNWGKEETLNIRGIGYRDKMKFQNVVRVSMRINSLNESSDMENIELNGDTYATFGLQMIGKYVLEISELGIYDLKEVGCNSHSEFAEKYFDNNAAQILFTEIMNFTKESEKKDNDTIEDIGVEVKN